MSEWFTYGSVRGAAGDGGPYRDSTSTSTESAGINRLGVENESGGQTHTRERGDAAAPCGFAWNLPTCTLHIVIVELMR